MGKGDSDRDNQLARVIDGNADRLRGERLETEEARNLQVRFLLFLRVLRGLVCRRKSDRT